MNPGPLAPEARIIPLDQAAIDFSEDVWECFGTVRGLFPIGNETRPDKERQDAARRGKTRNKRRQVKAKREETRRDKSGQGREEKKS